MAAALVAFSAQSAPTKAPLSPSIDQSVAAQSCAAGRVRGALFEATALAPGAKGSARFTVSHGAIEIALAVWDLPPATDVGPGFLTHSVWAITAEGLAVPLGELVVERGRGKLRTLTPLSSFGLIVTAEPHFAIAAPSEAVVLRTAGDTSLTARYRAVARSAYEYLAAAQGIPLALAQATSATRLAHDQGAAEFAAEPMARAENELARAQGLFANDPRSALGAAVARDATQAAGVAAAIAVERYAELRYENLLAESARREAAAEAAADEARAAADEARWKVSETEAREANEIRRREQAEVTAAQAEIEKRALRGRLLQQLNLVLETRDSARGLIVNLGDVLFDVGRFTLRSPAREKLAKLSGLVLANPGLRLEVEGHTDSTGNDDLNQELAEDRAAAVRDYLVEQRVAEDAISSRGYGETQPVASNETTAGRQQNRRVEIIVSGDAIGTMDGGTRP